MDLRMSAHVCRRPDAFAPAPGTLLPLRTPMFVSFASVVYSASKIFLSRVLLSATYEPLCENIADGFCDFVVDEEVRARLHVTRAFLQVPCVLDVGPDLNGRTLDRGAVARSVCGERAQKRARAVEQRGVRLVWRPTRAAGVDALGRGFENDDAGA